MIELADLVGMVAHATPSARAIADSAQRATAPRLQAAADERAMAAYELTDPERRSARLRFLGIIPPKRSAVVEFLTTSHADPEPEDGGE